MKFPFRRRQENSNTPPPASESSETVEELIEKGNQLEDGGDGEAALKLYERAIAIAPESWRARLNAGNALRLLERFEEAVVQYRRSLELNPDFAGAHVNLGNALIETGDFASAAGSYRTAARLRPEWTEPWFGLGCALERVPSPDEAVEAYAKALALDPAHAKVAANLAGLLISRGDAREARSVVADSRLIHPENVPLLLAQAEIEKQLGECESAVATYRRALTIDPNDLAVRSSYLFALNFMDTVGADVLLAEHRKYGAMLAKRVEPVRLRTRTNSDRPLKIGYVSPDFRRHSVSCFIEPLLRHHDRSTVDVYCYYNHATRDEITLRFAGLADHWLDIAGVDDDAVAKRIADDGIDILVDLAGHTSSNRLGVFARKPAPIQFTWLGYLCTTGVEAIDFRLCDAHTDPPGRAEAWQTEKPLRMPNAQWCYQPQVSLPEPSALPRIANGYWTFGSFNQASKLNTQLLHTWARLLDAIPGSHVRFVGIAHALMEDKIRAIFAAQDIADDRLEIVARIPIDAYFAQYREIDIALDSLPYNGATTTCDALLMGVPVATLAGSRSIARGGVSLLSAVGLTDWIAGSADELVALAQTHTRDPERLAALRATLPDAMRSSALMDGPRFARDIEAVFRSVWKERSSV
jgi:protein O-GlcNAc transferase